MFVFETGSTASTLKNNIFNVLEFGLRAAKEWSGSVKVSAVSASTEETILSRDTLVLLLPTDTILTQLRMVIVRNVLNFYRTILGRPETKF